MEFFGNPLEMVASPTMRTPGYGIFIATLRLSTTVQTMSIGAIGLPIPLRSTYLCARCYEAMDFLSFARALQIGVDDLDASSLQEWIEVAEAVSQRIKSYKIAVTRLVGGSIEQAVEVFSRLNSSGQTMSPDQMVSALTYRGGTEPNMALRIDAILDELGPVGFATVDRMSIFRSLLAISGVRDIMNAKWDTLAQQLQPQLDDSLNRTEVALTLAIEFLAEIGVSLGRLLPYSIQLVLLATAFDLTPNPSAEQRAELRRWFWASSWSRFFAGANTAQVRAAIEEMRDFAVGSKTKLAASAEQAQPFPQRFDLRSARVRALVLWQMTKLKPLDPNGHLIDQRELIASQDSAAFRLVSRASFDLAVSPANRILLPTPPRVTVVDALSGLSGSHIAPSHSITPRALDALLNGEYREFVALRAAQMASDERLFMAEVGVDPPEDEFAADIVDST